jgi:flagellin-like hook-associated protein FlgL
MGFNINTNIAALSAHNLALANSRNIDSSLAKLSSGLRINTAADDASGMAIADSLRSQASTLGQSIANLNDGVAIAQIADKAMDEQSKILDTVKTKLTQAAQDGQTTESRRALQADITRLLQSLNQIANTTSYNGQPLLSGSYINKSFQAGANANEAINLSINPTIVSKLGNTEFQQSKLLPTEAKKADPFGDVAIKLNGIQLQSVPIGYNNGEGVGVLSDVINTNSDLTGVRASYIVEHKYSEPNQPLVAGKTPQDFAINDVVIGYVPFEDNDRTGSLVSAINDKSLETGVVASIDERGGLVLNSPDGRAINMTTDSPLILNTHKIAYSATGYNHELDPVSAPDLKNSDDDGASNADSITTITNPHFLIAPAGSSLPDGIASVSIILDSNTSSPISATYDQTTGSIQPISNISSGTHTVQYQFTDANGYTSALSPSSNITIGTVGFNHELDPVSAPDLKNSDDDGASDTDNVTSVTQPRLLIAPAGSNLPTGIAGVQLILDGNTSTPITATYDLATGSIQPNSALSDGTYNVQYRFVDSNGFVSALSPSSSVTIDSSAPATVTSPVGAAISYNPAIGGYEIGSVDLSNKTLALATDLPTDVTSISLNFDNFGAGNEYLRIYKQDGTNVLYLKGDNSYNNVAPLHGLSDNNVDPTYVDTTNPAFSWESLVAAGTGTITIPFLSTGTSFSIEARGAVLTLNEGTIYTASAPSSTSSTSTPDTIPLTFPQASPAQSDKTQQPFPQSSHFDYSGLTTVGKLKLVDTATGAQIKVDGTGLEYIGMSATDNPDKWNKNLMDIDGIQSRYFDGRTLKQGIQESLDICDSAIQQLDMVRSDLGSVQNQMISTLYNITSTQVNIKTAESQIRDVDFASESANFSKYNILAQSGSFAMSQANTVQQNILKLLQ